MRTMGHAVMQALDDGAGGFFAQAGHNSVNQSGTGRHEQKARKGQSKAHMSKIAFVHAMRMAEKKPVHCGSGVLHDFALCVGPMRVFREC
jgi:hypothetical protein